MRLNQFISKSTTYSRRQADELISQGRIKLNQNVATLGQRVVPEDIVLLDNKIITPIAACTILLNKPVGYVCSRKQQDDSPTIYDLLAPQYRNLNSIGRLDKDSRGLILLTNDGVLAQTLSHPSQMKPKLYEVNLNRSLAVRDRNHIETGVKLEDGVSSMIVRSIAPNNYRYSVKISEGRNRQIRRTFDELGYTVTDLLRTEFGAYKLGDLPSGKVRSVSG